MFFNKNELSPVQPTYSQLHDACKRSPSNANLFLPAKQSRFTSTFSNFPYHNNTSEDPGRNGSCYLVVASPSTKGLHNYGNYQGGTNDRRDASPPSMVTPIKSANTNDENQETPPVSPEMPKFARCRKSLLDKISNFSKPEVGVSLCANGRNQHEEKSPTKSTFHASQILQKLEEKTFSRAPRETNKPVKRAPDVEINQNPQKPSHELPVNELSNEEYQSIQEKLKNIEEKIKKFKGQYSDPSGQKDRNARSQILCESKKNNTNNENNQVTSAVKLPPRPQYPEKASSPRNNGTNPTFAFPSNSKFSSPVSIARKHQPPGQESGFNQLVTQLPKSFGMTGQLGSFFGAATNTFGGTIGKEEDSFMSFLLDPVETVRNKGTHWASFNPFHDLIQQTMLGLQIIKLLPPPLPSQIESKMIFLPRRSCDYQKKTLIFDLDETLVHSTENPADKIDFRITVSLPSGEVIEAGVNVRPFAIEALNILSQFYEIVIFTASHTSYADAILDQMDPNKQYISHRVYRESCISLDEGIYIKDLRILANRRIEDLILVDNAAFSFGLQKENGIPISSYYDKKSDQELRHLTNFLIPIARAPDVRTILRDTFKLHLFESSKSPEEVFSKLTMG